MAKRRWNKDKVRKTHRRISRGERWKPNEADGGDNWFYVLPPTDEMVALMEKGGDGEVQPFVEVNVHWVNVDDQARALVCAEDFGRKCRPCEMVAEREEAGETEEAGEIVAQYTPYVNVLPLRRDRTTKEFYAEPEDAAYWKVPSARVFEMLLGFLGSDDYEDITDPETGYPLNLKATGSGLKRRYPNMIPSAKSVPLPVPFKDLELSNLVERFGRLYTYDQQCAILDGEEAGRATTFVWSLGTSVESIEEESDEESEAKKPETKEPETDPDQDQKEPEHEAGKSDDFEVDDVLMIEYKGKPTEATVTKVTDDAVYVKPEGRSRATKMSVENLQAILIDEDDDEPAKGDAPKEPKQADKKSDDEDDGPIDEVAKKHGNDPFDEAKWSKDLIKVCFTHYEEDFTSWLEARDIDPEELCKARGLTLETGEDE